MTSILIKNIRFLIVSLPFNILEHAAVYIAEQRRFRIASYGLMRLAALQ
jgi:hypothetical protein